MRRLFAGGVLGVLLVTGGGVSAADANRGKTLFTACQACHTEKPDALGPSLKGVVGRKSASDGDFRYSAPMRRANLTWDERNLRDYLTDPQKKVKGNRMAYSGLADATDVADVIAYLQTLK